MTSTLGKFLHTVLGYDSAPAVGNILSYAGYVIVVLGAYLLLPTGRPPEIRRVEPEPSASPDPSRELAAKT